MAGIASLARPIGHDQPFSDEPEFSRAKLAKYARFKWRAPSLPGCGYQRQDATRFGVAVLLIGFPGCPRSSATPGSKRQRLCRFSPAHHSVIRPVPAGQAILLPLSGTMLWCAAPDAVRTPRMLCCAGPDAVQTPRMLYWAGSDAVQTPRMFYWAGSDAVRTPRMLWCAVSDAVRTP